MSCRLLLFRCCTGLFEPFDLLELIYVFNYPDRMKLEILKGTRITLRGPTLSDAAVLQKHLSDPKVNRWLPLVPKPYTLECAKAWIRLAPTRIKSDSNLSYCIFKPGLNQIIGGVGIKNINRFDRSAELGYWIASDFWGEGYACEAGQLLCQYAFSRKQKFHRLYAWVHSENVGSIRVLEKLGFVREGVCRKASKATGRWKDDYLYAMLESDYRVR